MSAENCSGAQGRDRFLKRAPHDCRFAASRNRDDQLWHSEYCRDGHADRALGNRFKAVEPALGHLLRAAGRIQLDDLHVARVIEIGNGWIHEREMPVFADTQQTEFWIGCRKLLCIKAAYLIEIRRRAIDFMKRPHIDFLRQVLSEIATEGGCVFDRQSYIFIQMKAAHSIPGDAFDSCESFKCVLL